MTEATNGQNGQGTNGAQSLDDLRRAVQSVQRFIEYRQGNIAYNQKEIESLQAKRAEQQTLLNELIAKARPFDPTEVWFTGKLGSLGDKAWTYGEIYTIMGEDFPTYHPNDQNAIDGPKFQIQIYDEYIERYTGYIERFRQELADARAELDALSEAISAL